MGSTALAMHSYIAECLNNEFGTVVMEVVAAQFLVERLVHEFERQSGGEAPTLRACVRDAFQALQQIRGLDSNAMQHARQSFESLTSKLHAAPGHRGGFKT